MARTGTRSPRNRPRGLVLVQIDGLARPQIERALAKGRMPFLAQLLRDGGYQLHSHFSGIPSTTPAVQGELFYGVKMAVPAFGFRDHTTGHSATMLSPRFARRVESRLKEKHAPLLQGGSAYANIYTGGAERARFCSTRPGDTHRLLSIQPMTTVMSGLAYLWSLARAAPLLVVESLLAVMDAVRGLVWGKGLLKELTFVPTRVSICILLRELVTTSVMLDIKHGRPVVHVNFLGYDEQAHRRGPDSAFAHWTLRGIDDAIRRIWSAAAAGNGRDYTLWIYSDHGQEAAVPFAKASGTSLQKAVTDLARSYGIHPSSLVEIPSDIQLRRFGLLSRSPESRSETGRQSPRNGADNSVQVIAVGAVGHVYFRNKLTWRRRAVFAQDMVCRLGVPLALTRDSMGKVHAWNEQGCFHLPEQAYEVLGDDHPFAVETARGLVGLVRHPDAGAIVACGWRANGRPLTFAAENGAHGGPGAMETHGFALVPQGVFSGTSPNHHIRPLQLRRAALRFLGR